METETDIEELLQRLEDLEERVRELELIAWNSGEPYYDDET